MIPMQQNLPKPELGQTVKGVIQGDEVPLQFCLDMPKQAPRGVMLLTHPHPLYGGSMDNKVVYTLSRIALQAGCVSLRFQFRGVGESGGSHDEGHGETRDTAFMLQALRQNWPDIPSLLGGFSFGAYMAIKVAAQDAALAGLVTIAPPLAYAGDAAVPQPQCDWLLLHGDADDVVDHAQTHTLAQAMAQPPQWVSVPGTGHFFHGQLSLMREHVTPWISQKVAN